MRAGSAAMGEVSEDAMMDATEVLKKAWSAVARAGLPNEIHPVAFREAVRLLVPDAHTAPPGQATVAIPAGTSGDRNPAGGSKNGNGGPPVSEEEIYIRVAAQTGVEREKLERLVHLDDNVLRMSLPGIKLGNNNADRAPAVAQILTIMRGFGLGESETSLELIRAECSRLKVYDSTNFSSHISKMNGFVVSGSGQNRRVRAKGAAVQAFQALVDRLLGES